MAEFIIKHLQFPYEVPVLGPDGVQLKDHAGNALFRRVEGQRGENHDIPLERDIERGLRLGAFETEEEKAEAKPPVHGTIEELSEYIKSDHPTISELLNMTGGDPDLAERVLEAETLATAGNPRRGLVAAVAKMAGRAEGPFKEELDEGDKS